MKRYLLSILLFLPLILANGQIVDKSESAIEGNTELIKPAEEINTKIFPVPVINNRFTITSDKSFTFVRLTNIIGQETTRVKYSTARNRADITFSQVQKGIYLVYIEYEDKTKTVKKIIIDSQ